MTVIAKTLAAILYWIRVFVAGDYGYSQPNRWTGLKGTPGDFDCTSLIGAILLRAGYITEADLKGAWYSGDGSASSPIPTKLKARGWTIVSAKGKSLAWLVAHVLAGCVLIGPGHGVMGVGDGKIVSWEYSELGTAKGKLGRQKGERVGIRALYLRSRGWLTLCIPPADPKPVAKITPLALRAAIASQQAQHFSGPADYRARGVAMRDLGASLIGCTETTVTAKGKTAWSGRVAMQAGLGKDWTRAAFLALALFWQPAKYSTAGTRRTVGFAKGDIWHGAMIVPLLRKDAKSRLDVGIVHVRPATVATDTQKHADIARALALVDPAVPTILMGDWASNPDAQMAAAGFTRASLKVDSYDADGVQLIDAVYLSRHLAGDAAKSLDPGALSDHTWLSVHVTKAAASV